jgi:mono/diheme cytochrome c family protein
MNNRSIRIAAAAAAMIAASGAQAQDKAKIDAGEGLYNDYCYTCHGERLVSSGQTFDLRRLTANDRARFENSVFAGKGQMPPWKGVLNNEQVDLIWQYIRANAHQK